LLPVGVIGLGRIGSLHAAHLATRIPGGRLAVVADVREQVARVVGERFDVPWSTSPKAVLEDDRVRAVVIATPTPSHIGLVQQATVAGKHIFCEKPIALDVDTGAASVAAAQEAGVTLQVGFQIRYDPQFALLRHAVRAGEVGDVVLFQARLRDMRPPDRDYLRDCGGLMLDGAIHLFDLARWTIGEIAQVTAVGGHSPGAENPTFDLGCSAVILRFASGTLGILENCRSCGYGFECSAEVVGSRRTVRICEQPGIEWLEPGRKSVDLVGDFIQRFDDAYRTELAAFIQAVQDERPAVPSGSDATAAASLAAAAECSLREARTVVVASSPAVSRTQLAHGVSSVDRP
jgi:myo-inositol 2-dehydrogenase/D-chiro-inositol 1-dehydrogenase